MDEFPTNINVLVMKRVKPKFHLARQVASRHDMTRSTCRARRDERVEPCCSTSSIQPKCMGSTRRTCRVVSRRDVTSQVEFGFKRSCYQALWLLLQPLAIRTSFPFDTRTSRHHSLARSQCANCCPTECSTCTTQTTTTSVQPVRSAEQRRRQREGREI